MKAITFDASQFMKWLSLFVYILNLTMVGADLVLYVRNHRLDKLAAKSE